MDFLPSKIATYAENHSTAESDLLRNLNRETHLNVLSPRMLSGHLQGRVLSMISYMIAPELIVEIGTYTGYSALCLAEGLKENGRLITIDFNAELKNMHNQFLNEFPQRKKIEVIYDDAKKVIPTLPDEIDIVFIDADKENYSLYFDLIFNKVKPGGFILADNVLWSGKVVEEVKESDKSTLALLDFNKKIMNDDRVENVLLPIRDGIMIIRKK